MRHWIIVAALLPMLGGPAIAQETVKIGYIDPLSGGGASIGEVGLKTFQFLADELNAKGGILGKKVEIVPLDNKTNPQESLIQAQKAMVGVSLRKAHVRPSVTMPELDISIASVSVRLAITAVAE
jgi:branched-chain amino acid transport system substrate-binding protein